MHAIKHANSRRLHNKTRRLTQTNMQTLQTHAYFADSRRLCRLTQTQTDSRRLRQTHADSDRLTQTQTDSRRLHLVTRRLPEKNDEFELGLNEVANDAERVVTPTIDGE